MNSTRSFLRGWAFLLLLLFVAPVEAAPPDDRAGAAGGVAEELASLREEVAELRKLLEAVQANPALQAGTYLRVNKEEMAGVKGPHVILEGINLHLRSGSGFTSDRTPGTRKSPPIGLGNLIIGYNEEPNPEAPLQPGERIGSHNLVMGEGNRYMSYSGIVHGWEHTLRREHSAAIAGDTNDVSSAHSAIVAGWKNKTSAISSAVIGGTFNTAAGAETVVLGGEGNKAGGRNSVVTGGKKNTARGKGSVVSGGYDVTLLPPYSWTAGNRQEEEKKENQ